MERVTIGKILTMISESYRGRFEATENTNRVWWHLLQDLDDKNIMAATYDLCGRLKFPPCVAEVREKAVSLSEGILGPPTGYEAWERVLEFCSGNEKIKLSEDERRALKLVGGTWSVKNSKSSSFDRKDFISAYEAYVTKRRLQISALPSVAALAESNAPPVPELPERTETRENTISDPKAVKSMLAGFRASHGIPDDWN